MLVREVERVERRERKKQLEDRWSLMKWVTKYIEENEGNWKREELIRKEKGEKLSVGEWEKLTEEGKQEEIMRYETQKEKSKRKSNSWRDWRPPATFPTKENPWEKLMNGPNSIYDEKEDIQEKPI